MQHAENHWSRVQSILACRTSVSRIEVQLKADREPNCQEAATRCHCKFKKMTTARTIKVTDLLAQGRLHKGNQYKQKKYKHCVIFDNYVGNVSKLLYSGL